MFDIINNTTASMYVGVDITQTGMYGGRYAAFSGTINPGQTVQVDPDREDHLDVFVTNYRFGLPVGYWYKQKKGMDQGVYISEIIDTGQYYPNPLGRPVLRPTP